MKNFKKALCVLLVGLILISCVGCVKMNYGIVLRKDGTASISMKVSLEESAYESLRSLESMGSEDSNESDTDSEDELDLEAFVKETIDGKVYYSYEETTEFSSYDLLAETLMSDELTDGSTIFSSAQIVTSDDGRCDFNFVTSVIDSEDISSEAGGIPLPDDWFVITMTVKMPGNITETNGEKISNDTVRFNMNDFTASTTYTVISEPPATSLLIVMIVSGVLFVGGAAFLIVKKVREGMEDEE